VPDNIGEKQRIDTPMITEENIKGPQGQGNAHSQLLNVPGKGASGKATNHQQYFDVSPKVIKKNKIYHISNKFPVSKPYSNPSDWQKLISKS